MFGSGARRDEFESAALPHLNDIYRTAFSLLRNPTEAEDLTQDVYLNAWKSFDRFQPGTNCRAWLFKILMMVVRSPYKLTLAIRNHRMRKNVKVAAKGTHPFCPARPMAISLPK